MKEIPLTKGYCAIVDDSDYAMVSEWNWQAFVNIRGAVYGRRSPRRKGTPRSIHELIMQPPTGVRVDHKDGDGLNNRRSNLRLATDRQNSLNKGDAHNREMKGVSNSRGRYRAYITPHRKQIHLGVFTDIDEAKRAYDRAAIAAFGEWARTNFPLTDYQD